MEQRIKDRFSESILSQALVSYGINPEDIQELDGFESYIYEFSRGEEEGILRIAHSVRRSSDLIQGELDWINYLKSGGSSVAEALISCDNKWVEEIDDGTGGYFLANAFEKAAGQPRRGEWTDELLFEYGRQIGLMHKLTTDYQPANPDWKRPNWDDPIHMEVDQFIPPMDRKITQILSDLVRKIKIYRWEKQALG